MRGAWLAHALWNIPTVSHTYGRCLGGETRHLPPQVGRPVSYPIGPFSSELTATLWTRLRGAAPDRLFLALLTKAPSPDGDGHEELVAEDYARWEVHLADWAGRHSANTNAIWIKVKNASAPVTHIGLVDEAGVLHYYGRLLSTRASNTPPTEFEFRPFALRVIRLRSGDVRPN